MRTAAAMLAFVLSSSITYAEDHKIVLTAKGKLLPPFKSIVLVAAGSPGPTAPQHKPAAVVKQLGESLVLSEPGPFDVYWQPKSGLSVLIKSAVKLDPKNETMIVVNDYLGAVSLRGDDQPRGTLIVVTQDDPGVGERGHRPIQSGGFRDDLVVPDGFYSMWLVPENNARPRRIIDRFRVLAGKSVPLD